MRKYKNIRTYRNARRRKEYNRYSRMYDYLKAKLEDKGTQPYSAKFSYQEYFAKKREAIDDYKESMHLPSNAKITIPNYQRDLINSQAYYRDFKEVVNARKQIKEKYKNIKTQIANLDKVDTADFDDIQIEALEETRKNLEAELNFLKEANKYSTAEIRSGKQEFLDLLKDTNDYLKEKYKNMTSFDRRDWIRREFFGYAS